MTRTRKQSQNNPDGDRDHKVEHHSPLERVPESGYNEEREQSATHVDQHVPFEINEEDDSEVGHDEGIDELSRTVKVQLRRLHNKYVASLTELWCEISTSLKSSFNDQYRALIQENVRVFTSIVRSVVEELEDSQSQGMNMVVREIKRLLNDTQAILSGGMTREIIRQLGPMIEKHNNVNERMVGLLEERLYEIGARNGDNTRRGRTGSQYGDRGFLQANETMPPPNEVPHRPPNFWSSRPRNFEIGQPSRPRETPPSRERPEFRRFIDRSTRGALGAVFTPEEVLLFESAPNAWNSLLFPPGWRHGIDTIPVAAGGNGDNLPPPGYPPRGVWPEPEPPPTGWCAGRQQPNHPNQGHPAHMGVGVGYGNPYPYDPDPKYPGYQNPNPRGAAPYNPAPCHDPW
ncbi:hypothetical protein RND81_14G247900 [Saponaria officinalis]|uniref:Uncharacterized protein n=1 Tax=Saponaria officinalis TaxID=3572 RepID=A0AAW1GUX0_SAPOF